MNREEYIGQLGINRVGFSEDELVSVRHSVLGMYHEIFVVTRIFPSRCRNEVIGRISIRDKKFFASFDTWATGSRTLVCYKMHNNGE